MRRQEHPLVFQQCRSVDRTIGTDGFRKRLRNRQMESQSKHRGRAASTAAGLPLDRMQVVVWHHRFVHCQRFQLNERLLTHGAFF